MLFGGNYHGLGFFLIPLEGTVVGKKPTVIPE